MRIGGLRSNKWSWERERSSVGWSIPVLYFTLSPDRMQENPNQETGGPLKVDGSGPDVRYIPLQV